MGKEADLLPPTTTRVKLKRKTPETIRKLMLKGISTPKVDSAAAKSRSTPSSVRNDSDGRPLPVVNAKATTLSEGTGQSGTKKKAPTSPDETITTLPVSVGDTDKRSKKKKPSERTEEDVEFDSSTPESLIASEHERKNTEPTEGDDYRITGIDPTKQALNDLWDDTGDDDTRRRVNDMIEYCQGLYCLACMFYANEIFQRNTKGVFEDQMSWSEHFTASEIGGSHHTGAVMTLVRELYQSAATSGADESRTSPLDKLWKSVDDIDQCKSYLPIVAQLRAATANLQVFIVLARIRWESLVKSDSFNADWTNLLDADVKAQLKREVEKREAEAKAEKNRARYVEIVYGTQLIRPKASFPKEPAPCWADYPDTEDDEDASSSAAYHINRLSIGTGDSEHLASGVKSIQGKGDLGQKKSRAAPGSTDQGRNQNDNPMLQTGIGLGIRKYTSLPFGTLHKTPGGTQHEADDEEGKEWETVQRKAPPETTLNVVATQQAFTHLANATEPEVRRFHAQCKNKINKEGPDWVLKWTDQKARDAFDILALTDPDNWSQWKRWNSFVFLDKLEELIIKGQGEEGKFSLSEIWHGTKFLLNIEKMGVVELAVAAAPIQRKLVEWRDVIQEAEEGTATCKTLLKILMKLVKFGEYIDPAQAHGRPQQKAIDNAATRAEIVDKFLAPRVDLPVGHVDRIDTAKMLLKVTLDNLNTCHRFKKTYGGVLTDILAGNKRAWSQDSGQTANPNEGKQQKPKCNDCGNRHWGDCDPELRKKTQDKSIAGQLNKCYVSGSVRGVLTV